jgi:predicted secreted Zn-dependent protease
MLLPSWTISSRSLIGVAVGAGLLLETTGVAAGVRSSTQIEAYRVGGTTAASLVSYMRNHPYPGEHGDAVANIVPRYSLSIATKNAGATCKASSVDLNVRFLMTLPHATNASGMSPATRSAWTNFVSFARRHEESHRGIYLQCASGFVAKAMRLTASSCLALQSNVRSLLETEKRACDRRQNAFDRGQYRSVLNLGLFAMAKSSGRKPARVASVSGPSSALEAPR